MKHLTLITSFIALFIISIAGVSAYPFMDYGHDATYNDTAEIGTDPYTYGWTDTYNTGFAYTTANPFNGSKSIETGASLTYMAIDLNPYDNSANYTIQFALYLNSSFSTGVFHFGITSDTGSGYYGGLYLDPSQAAYGSNYSVIRHDLEFGAPQPTIIPFTYGWQIVKYEVRDSNCINISINGQEINSYCVGAQSMTTIGRDIRIGVGTADVQFFMDDIHMYNATIGAPPPPPSAVNYTVTLRANNTNTSTMINSFSTTFNSIGKSTTNGTTIYGQISNGTYASSSITASGYVAQSGVSIPVAGDTTYTFQMVETPPTPPSPTPAPPENHAIVIIVALFAVVTLLGAGIYEFLNPHLQSIVYKYAAWIVGIIAAVAVIMILASM